MARKATQRLRCLVVWACTCLCLRPFRRKKNEANLLIQTMATVTCGVMVRLEAARDTGTRHLRQAFIRLLGHPQGRGTCYRTRESMHIILALCVIIGRDLLELQDKGWFYNVDVLYLLRGIIYWKQGVRAQRLYLLIVKYRPSHVVNVNLLLISTILIITYSSSFPSARLLFSNKTLIVTAAERKREREKRVYAFISLVWINCLFFIAFLLFLLCFIFKLFSQKRVESFLSFTLQSFLLFSACIWRQPQSLA